MIARRSRMAGQTAKLLKTTCIPEDQFQLKSAETPENKATYLTLVDDFKWVCSIFLDFSLNSKICNKKSQKKNQTQAEQKSKITEQEEAKEPTSGVFKKLL